MLRVAENAISWYERGKKQIAASWRSMTVTLAINLNGYFIYGIPPHPPLTIRSFLPCFPRYPMPSASGTRRKTHSWKEDTQNFLEPPTTQLFRVQTRSITYRATSAERWIPIIHRKRIQAKWLCAKLSSAASWNGMQEFKQEGSGCPAFKM